MVRNKCIYFLIGQRRDRFNVTSNLRLKGRGVYRAAGRIDVAREHALSPDLVVLCQR